MHTPPRTYRQLQPEDRVTLAALKQLNYTASAMARVLGRPVGTITRELKRNSAGGDVREHAYRRGGKLRWMTKCCEASVLT